MKPAPMTALLIALVLAFSATACVEDIGEIDRTQANALHKADFRGAWYKLGAVTDMPASSGYGFVGYTNFGGKVIFDIQEEVLVVYPFSEKVKDGDAKWHKRKIRNYWDAGKEKEFVEVVVGNPIGLYPITSHFDIQRGYSAATGAQNNILEENTTDRPWYERKYMRVDWMGNTHADPFAFKNGEISVSPVDHYVQEHEGGDPNRFHMQDGYFDYTRRLHGRPQSTGPCSTYSLAPGDCSGSVFEIRISYKRVDPRAVNDFEIRDYHDNPDGDRFGYFLASRYTYDEDFGLTYTGHDYKAQIWNLWQQSKVFEPALDAEGKTTPCRTNYDCAKPTVCDQKQLFDLGVCSSGKRIEYTERGLRPIVYHLSAGHPVTHLPAAYQVADNWSAVFKDTVSWLFFWEQKWKEDGIKGFEGGQTNFGQRYCESNADCNSHALGAFEVQDSKDSSSMFIATSDAKQGVWVQDVLEHRKNSAALAATGGKIDGGAFIMFVNASPGTKGAVMQAGAAKVGPVDFKAGVINGHDTAVRMDNEDAGRMTVGVTVGGKTYTLENADIKANQANFVIFYGGDRVALVRNPLSTKGVRIFHGASTGTGEANGKSFSTGPVAEAGINGVRGQADVPYGKASDYLYYVGTTANATLIGKGSRPDVNCADIDGVSQCIGWKQHLGEADRAKRLEIRQTLPAMFVQCSNVYSGDDCSATDKGNPAAMNDCRYWVTHPDGTETNPCKQFVADHDKPKILGDVRYNYIYWITNPHASSPLGYGPSASDPDTGQLIWGTAHIYGAPLTTYGQYGKDLVDLINGDLPVSDLTNGAYIRKIMQSQNQAGYEDSLPGAAKGHFHDADRHTSAATSGEEAARRATADISNWSKPIKESELAELRAHEQELMALQDPKVLSAKLLKEFPTYDVASSVARLKKIEGTAYERAMINDEMALVMSNGQVQPGDVLPPEMVGAISPLGWSTPQPQIDDRYRMMKLGMENIYSASFLDTALVGMAKRLKCQPGQVPTEKLPDGKDNIGDALCYKGDALLLALQTAIFRGVLEHEIGHTVGLRHNFSASADALNYFEPYYSIREKEVVYCRSFSTPFGVITANDMCENILGETCEPLACGTDADCPEGYACGDSSGTNRCLDTQQNVLGTCHGEVEAKIKCTSDANCGGGGVCTGGICFEKMVCNANENCSDGEKCVAGICTDTVDGSVRTAVKYDGSQQELLKYMPRAAPTDNEIAKRRTEYQYSSIMDYGQKINADFEGLGKYDYAAIRYGYGRLTDVFADTSFMRRQVEKVANNSSSTLLSASWRMNTGSWEFAGAFRHPFEYLNNWMPPEYMNKRDAVPSFFVDAEERYADKYGRHDHDRTMFQVPYKYCSDEYRGGSLGCYYFDTGAHMEEIVYHAAEQMREYYIFDAFKRERMWFSTGGSPLGYMGRILDRYLLPIGAAARYYAVYNNIYRVYSFFTFVDEHPMYLNALRRASEASFRELTAMLSSPAPGHFALDKASNTYVNTSYTAGANGAEDLNIPLGVGKLPWTTFSTKAGYYYADHPAWIGSYWDKVAAIITMTSSSASFLSDFVGEQLPIFRGTAIGFNTIYPKELSTILGGLAAGATDQIGMVVDDSDKANKVLVPRDPFKPVDLSKPKVEPSVMNLSLRLYAAWQAIANLPAGFDPSYTDSMAVWLKGSGVSHDFGCDAVTSPDGGACDSIIEFVEFEDPFGNKTYVAPKVNYNKDYFSPTFYMLTRLNKLKQQWEQAAPADKAKVAARMKEELEVVDYFRLLYKVYGSIGL